MQLGSCQIWTFYTPDGNLHFLILQKLARVPLKQTFSPCDYCANDGKDNYNAKTKTHILESKHIIAYFYFDW